MTEGTVPTTTDAGEPQGKGATPVLPLAYEPRSARKRDDLLLVLTRRTVFAVGMGVLAAGLTLASSDRPAHLDAHVFVGWGAGLVAWVIPLPAWWRNWPLAPRP